MLYCTTYSGNYTKHVHTRCSHHCIEKECTLLSSRIQPISDFLLLFFLEHNGGEMNMSLAKQDHNHRKWWKIAA